MKIRLLLLTAALLVCAYATTVSQQSPQPTPTTTPSLEQTTKVRDAKPEEIPFTYDKEIFGNIKINDIAKVVYEPGEVGFPDEAPAHSCFGLQDKRPLPAYEKGPRYFYPAYSFLCIFPLTDPSVTNFATSYPHVDEAAVKLRKLLKARRLTFTFRDLNDLPFNNATGSIKSRVQLLSFKGGSGLLFLTQYSQELWPNPVNNEELTCNFQGLTDDGKYYVAARLAITHPRLPRGIDFTEHIYRDDKLRYLRREEQLLNSLSEESFQPSLKVLKALISSISIK